MKGPSHFAVHNDRSDVRCCIGNGERESITCGYVRGENVGRYKAHRVRLRMDAAVFMALLMRHFGANHAMMQCQHHTKNSNRLVCTYICLVASPSPSATDAYLRLRRRFHVHASGGAAPPMMSGTMSLRRWSSARSFTAAAVSAMVSSSTFNLCASSRSRESDSVRTASVNLKTCRPEESTPLTKQQTSEHRHFVMSVASCTED